MLTMNEINRMSQDEINQMNRTLGRKVLLKFAAFFALKWAAIIGISFLGKRMYRHAK